MQKSKAVQADKVKAEKYIKDKSKKADKMKAGESVRKYAARVHGVTDEELKANGFF